MLVTLWSSAKQQHSSSYPTGVLYDHITPVIGNGVVVDLGVLIKEIGMLEAKGVSCDRLKLSGNAHLFSLSSRLDVVFEDT